jgi:23S rRNA (cytosine1962-C5)-methyltransferase
MLVARDWESYELLDAGHGEKLERWGDVVLRRPDPQAIWKPLRDERFWGQADARYVRSNSGGGQWERYRRMRSQWSIRYRDWQFYIEPTGFKHTGLFPEQAANWDWMEGLVRRAGRSVRALNLFAYTGGASVALAAGGAEVCHVDAAKRMVQRAKENLGLSGLGSRPVRFITDDVMKFIQREQRRGSVYDAIVMDPPSYGRGPTGELWKLEDELYALLSAAAQLLSRQPLFVLVNTYTTGFSPIVAANMLKSLLKTAHGGRVTCGEIGLPIAMSDLLLPCGSYGRWVADGAE